MTKISDPMGQAFMQFMEKQGVKFIDLCENCQCMTHTTTDGKCAKCGADKEGDE